MFKRVNVFVLLLFFIASVLIYASGKSDAAKADGVEIIYTRWAGNQEARDFQILVDKFMELHPGINVKTEFLPWDIYWDKIKISVSSGDAPDVISLSQKLASPYITKAAFLPLNDLEGAKARLDEMPEGTKDAVVYKEKIYAIPVGLGVRAVIYNKALFDEAGVPYPSKTEPMTWDEFIEIGKKLTKVENDEIVQYAAQVFKQEIWEAMVVQMGGQLMDNYIKPTKILLNTPEGINGLKLMMKCINEQIFPPFSEEWTGPWGTPDTAIVTGKVAMMHTGLWGLGAVEAAGIDYGTAPLPMGKKRANRGYLNSLAIFRDSRKADAAWTFIKWMTSVEGQLEFAKTGDLPANKDALEASKKDNARPQEVTEAFYSELPYIITGPMVPTRELDTLLNDIITQLFQGQLSPEEAAEIIETDGNELIQEVYSDM